MNFRSLVVALVLVVAVCGTADGQFYRNRAFEPKSIDSISLGFVWGDTLMQPWHAGANDTIFLSVYGPSGDSVYAEAIGYDDARITKQTVRAAGPGNQAHYTFSEQISKIDGDGYEGIYSIVLTAYEDSLDLATPFEYTLAVYNESFQDKMDSMTAQMHAEFGFIIDDARGVLIGSMDDTLTNGLYDTVESDLGAGGAFDYDDVNFVQGKRAIMFSESPNAATDSTGINWQLDTTSIDTRNLSNFSFWLYLDTAYRWHEGAYGGADPYSAPYPYGGAAGAQKEIWTRSDGDTYLKWLKFMVGEGAVGSGNYHVVELADTALASEWSYLSFTQSDFTAVGTADWNNQKTWMAFYLDTDSAMTWNGSDTVETWGEVRVTIDDVRVNKRTRPVVMITLDDAMETQYTHALPILNDYPFSATYAIIGERITHPTDTGLNNSWLSISQVDSIYSAGNDIGNHTWYGTSLASDSVCLVDGMGLNRLRESINDMHVYLVDRGWKRGAGTIHWPFQCYGSRPLEVAKELHTFGLYGKAGNFYDHVRPLPEIANVYNYLMPLEYFDFQYARWSQPHSIDSLKARVDRTIETGGVFIFGFHSLRDAYKDTAQANALITNNWTGRIGGSVNVYDAVDTHWPDDTDYLFWDPDNDVSGQEVELGVENATGYGGSKVDSTVVSVRFRASQDMIDNAPDSFVVITIDTSASQPTFRTDSIKMSELSASSFTTFEMPVLWGLSSTAFNYLRVGVLVKHTAGAGNDTLFYSWLHARIGDNNHTGTAADSTFFRAFCQYLHSKRTVLDVMTTSEYLRPSSGGGRAARTLAAALETRDSMLTLSSTVSGLQDSVNILLDSIYNLDAWVSSFDASADSVLVDGSVLGGEIRDSLTHVGAGRDSLYAITNRSSDTVSVATATTTVNGLAADVITAASIQADAIGASEIATDAITATEIAADAIGASEIATDAIGSAEVATDAIGAAEIAANAITVSEIADNAITAAKIAADAIGSSEIAADAITSSELSGTAADEIRDTLTHVGAGRDSLYAITDRSSDSITTATNLTTNNDKTGYSLAADQSAVTIGTVNNLASDAIQAADFANDAAYMVYGGGVWVDTTNGTDGATVGTHGIPSTPTMQITDAKTIADAIGTKVIYLIGGANGYKIPETMENYTFIGVGDPNLTNLDFNSQDVDGSTFINLYLNGTKGGTNNFYLKQCVIDSVEGFEGYAYECWLLDTVVFANGANGYFDECQSQVAGNDAPSLDFGPGANKVSFRNWSGGLYLFNGTATDSMSIEGRGNVVADASCSNMPVTIRGMFTVSEEDAADANFTYTATAQFAVDSLITKMQDSVLQALDYTNNTYFVMRNGGDTLKSLMEDLDSLIVYTTQMRDSVQFLVTGDSNTTAGITLGVWGADTSNAAWNDDLSKFGEWNAQAQVGGGGGSSNDSLQIRRWVWDSTSSKYWGGVGYKRTIDTALQSPSASASITDADMGSIADSVWLKSRADISSDLDGDTSMFGRVVPGASDSIIAHAPHGDNFAATGAGGAGAVTFTLRVNDTLNDVRLQNVIVGVTELSGAAVTGTSKQLTTPAGATTWNLDANTAYIFSARRSGYQTVLDTFNTQTTTNDSLYTYPIPVGSPADPNLKRLWVDVDTYDSDSTVAGGTRICAALWRADNVKDTIPYAATDSLFLGVIEDRVCAAATGGGRGRAILDLIPNSSITPYTEYIITATRRGKDLWSFRVYLNGTDTENVLKLYLSDL